MKKIMLVLSAILAFSTGAQASKDDGVPSTLYQTTVAPTLLTVVSTLSSMGEEMKQVLEAKDDAAEFLASEGKVRSLKLQNAFNTLRSVDASLRASDLELAEGILAL